MRHRLILLALALLTVAPATATAATLDDLATSRYAARDVRGFFTATYEGQSIDAPRYSGRIHFTFRGARSKPTLGFLLGTGAMPPVDLAVKVKRGTYRLSESGVYDDEQEHSCEVNRKRARFNVFIGARRAKGGFAIRWPAPTLGAGRLLPKSCRGFNMRLDGIDPNGITLGRITERRLTLDQLAARSRVVALRGQRTIRTPREYRWRGTGTAKVKWRMRFRLVRVR